MSTIDKYLRRCWRVAAVRAGSNWYWRNALEAFGNSFRSHPPRHWRTGVPLVELIRDNT